MRGSLPPIGVRKKSPAGAGLVSSCSQIAESSSELSRKRCADSGRAVKLAGRIGSEVTCMAGQVSARVLSQSNIDVRGSARTEMQESLVFKWLASYLVDPVGPLETVSVPYEPDSKR